MNPELKFQIRRLVLVQTPAQNTLCDSAVVAMATAVAAGDTDAALFVFSASSITFAWTWSQVFWYRLMVADMVMRESGGVCGPPWMGWLVPEGS